MIRFVLVSTFVTLLVVPELAAQKDKNGFDVNAWNTGLDATPAPYKGRNTIRMSKDGRAMAKRFRLDDALIWLKNSQNANGSFGGDGKSARDEIGLTGLSLLAFLGDGSTMRVGRYKDNVKKCVIWLRKQQKPSGQCASANSSGALLDHTIAAYAIAEAHGLSQYKLIRRNAVTAARYIGAQTDTNPQQLGWEVLLHHTLVNFKLDGLADHVRTTSKKALATAKKKGQRFSLQQPVAVLSRLVGPDAKPLPMAARNKSTPDTATLLTAAGVDLDKSDVDDAFWYFATLAMRANGGPDAEKWHEILGKSIETSHNDDGSWGPRSGGEGKAGKIYSTAMTVLILQSAFDGRVPDLTKSKPKSRPIIKRR